jgi:glycine cleavage system H protein
MMSQKSIDSPVMREVFGFQVPMEHFYFHQGHAWVAVESDDQVRVGMDHFSQKLLGPAEEVRLPEIGKVYYQNHLCMALVRQGQKASFEAPVDGAIETINPKVKQKPSLICEDPYGEGWLYTIKPTNLSRNLEKLRSGEDAVIWMEQETHRLLNLLEARIGVTLPDGGALVDDVYGNYQDLGWKVLVQEFFLKNLMKKGLIRPVR